MMNGSVPPNIALVVGLVVAIGTVVWAVRVSVDSEQPADAPEVVATNVDRQVVENIPVGAAEPNRANDASQSGPTGGRPTDQRGGLAEDVGGAADNELWESARDADTQVGQPPYPFMSDSRDEAWAAPAEARIYELIARSGIPLSTLQVECRQKVCRVQLIIPGSDAVDLGAALVEKLNALPGFGRVTAAIPLDGFSPVDAHLVREDSSAGRD